jgi:hypothetical protein
VAHYPVTVANPGMWSLNHLEQEDYGFPEPRPERKRPRLRLGVTISVTVLGFLIAALTAVMFVWLVDFAVEDLIGVLTEMQTSLSSPSAPTGEGAGSATTG